MDRRRGLQERAARLQACAALTRTLSRLVRALDEDQEQEAADLDARLSALGVKVDREADRVTALLLKHAFRLKTRGR